MISQNLFLDRDFSLSKMQFYSNLNARDIRNAIKNSKFQNFRALVNYHRINKAVSLIDNGYLKKHTLNSLSVESGFNSTQTFFREFKKQKKQTPLIYSLTNKFS